MGIQFIGPETIDPKRNDSYDNEVAKYIDVGDVIVRFYTVEYPIVSIGARQKQTEFYQIRRHSNGETLYIDEDTILYSIIFKTLDKKSKVFLEIQKYICEGFNKIGIPTSLAKETVTCKIKEKHCFNSIGKGEILLDGKKVIGSALVNRDNIYMQHSLLYYKEPVQWGRDDVNTDNCTIMPLDKQTIINTIRKALYEWYRSRQS